MHRRIAVIIDTRYQKTKSFDFFLDLLYTAYGETKVDLFYEASIEWWNSDLGYISHKDLYTTIIFLQIIPSAKILYNLRGKDIVCVPMYDNFHPYKLYLYYLKIFQVRFVSFSLLIHYFAQETLRIKSMYIQYYLPPLSHTLDYRWKNIFWWYRGDVSWDDVKKILGDQKIDRLTIKNVPSRLYKKLDFTQEDIQKYHIHIIDTFFPTHEEHYILLSQHNIFIAPRLKEGIGMSFLDALSIGMCVVWYDGATMNEYIVHDKNWLLTDFTKPVILDNYQILWTTAQKKYIEWYEYWERHKHEIIDFLNEAPTLASPHIMTILFYAFLYYAGDYSARFVRKVKTYIRRRFTN